MANQQDKGDVKMDAEEERTREETLWIKSKRSFISLWTALIVAPIIVELLVLGLVLSCVLSCCASMLADM